MIAMRIMLSDGENKFREYIQALRQNFSTARPDLNVEPYSREFLPQISIDEIRIFNTKMELAEYLEGVFSGNNIRREGIIEKNGLWTWLAYIWFDQLAPIDSAGTRNIKDEAKYICSSDYRDYYRHLIAGAYNIYSLHDRENSRIFLYSPVYEHNDFIEQFASRQFIISYRNIVETITRLYLDINNGKPKRGAQSRGRKGNIRRFVNIIQQFELTYDIYSMDPEQILNLLPDEFSGWKNGTR
ncbi:MAG: hypothetical protein NC937_02080 [Candidatus Omnitrophica bacterium]|nr:hypothetical protein [Candidatus Omnitrophota bacterium]